MKKLFVFLLLLLPFLALAQPGAGAPGTTPKPAIAQPKAPSRADSILARRMTAPVGEAAFNSFIIFDSLMAQQLNLVNTGKDTMAVRWGMNQMPCADCADTGYKVLVRVFDLQAPGYRQQVAGVPVKCGDPSWDEAWQTTAGPLFISLDSNNQPSAVLLVQQNRTAVKWSWPAKP